MTYYQVIQNALEMFHNSYKYCYFYGAKGQKMTEETMNALIAAEPTYFGKYTTQEIASIKNYSRGKIGMDCSGFVSMVLNQSNYSTGYFNASDVHTSPKNGKEGSGLYTTFSGTGRHIGIDIGYGYFLHCAKELESIKLGKISEYSWEESFEFENVDYEGAKS